MCIVTAPHESDTAVCIGSGFSDRNGRNECVDGVFPDVRLDRFVGIKNDRSFGLNDRFAFQTDILADLEGNITFAVI